MGEYMLLGLEPCTDVWDEIRPPEWWTDETGRHPGTWRANSTRAVLTAFAAAYPNLHPKAKPYRRLVACLAEEAPSDG